MRLDRNSWQGPGAPKTGVNALLSRRCTPFPRTIKTKDLDARDDRVRAAQRGRGIAWASRGCPETRLRGSGHRPGLVIFLNVFLADDFRPVVRTPTTGSLVDRAGTAGRRGPAAW